MQGKTHLKFAPIFTLGAGLLLTRNLPGLTGGGQSAVFLALSAFASTLSANVPDADIYTFGPNKEALLKGKVIEYRAKNGSVKKAFPPKKISMRLWALFFLALGVRSHRHWKSHCASMWLVIWTAIMGLALMFIPPDYRPYIFPAVFGYAMGFLSHIVGDAYTKSGIPLFPWSKKDHSMMPVGFAKASSDFYNTIFLFVAINILVAIFNYKLLFMIYYNIYLTLLTLLRQLRS